MFFHYFCVFLWFLAWVPFFPGNLGKPGWGGIFGGPKRRGVEGGEGGARGVSGEGSCGHFLAPLSVSHVCWKFAPTRPCHLWDLAFCETLLLFMMWHPGFCETLQSVEPCLLWGFAFCETLPSGICETAFCEALPSVRPWLLWDLAFVQCARPCLSHPAICETFPSVRQCPCSICGTLPAFIRPCLLHPVRPSHL